MKYLFDDYKPTRWAQAYYCIYMLRRMVYASSMIFVSNNVVQVSMFVVTQLLTLVYAIAVRPFKRKIMNFLNATNEVFLFAIGCLLFKFSDLEPDASEVIFNGYIVFGLILLQILWNWIFMVIELVPEIINGIMMIKKSYFTNVKISPVI